VVHDQKPGAYGQEVPDLADAHTLAAALLDTPELARRWAHVQDVAARQSSSRPPSSRASGTCWSRAAWLHDIGYSPIVADTGLHSLDGARYLHRLGYRPRLCSLVAHHSGARFEAAQRGLAADFDAFVAEESTVADALTAADLTTSPDGDPVTVTDRIDEILARYASDSPVHRAIRASRSSFERQVTRALQRQENGDRG
jgi:hypothetical protein